MAKREGRPENKALESFGLDKEAIQQIEQLKRDLAEHYLMTVQDAEDYLNGKCMPLHASKQMERERADEARRLGIA